MGLFSKGDYSKKDIFNVLREVKHDIIENNEYYGGMNRHIYRKATDDAVEHLDKYIVLDDDSFENKIKRDTAKAIYEQLLSSRSYISLMKRDYKGEHKETYDGAIDDIRKIINKYMLKYRGNEKFRP